MKTGENLNKKTNFARSTLGKVERESVFGKIPYSITTSLYVIV
jgi:hypothetical protein